MKQDEADFLELKHDERKVDYNKNDQHEESLLLKLIVRAPLIGSLFRV